MQARLAAALASGERLADPAVAKALEEAGGHCQRAAFHVPPTPATAVLRTPGSPCVYLCGNSLGLQPRCTREYVLQDLDKWAEHGVEGHFTEPRPWVTIDETVRDGSAALVGALPSEVVVMNSLTANLHLLMVSFYAPSTSRWKILLEDHAFPSDTYAIASQVALHGRDPVEGCIKVRPREGEETLRTEDILAAIAAAGDELALVLLPGVQYYTGQVLDMATITAAGHAAGAMVGWDLAHAVGNVPLSLHAWGADFAAWCTYKYVNAGPGGIAGAFVHEKHADAAGDGRKRLAGWWGHRKSDRFAMGSEFVPTQGAAGWQLSNPPVLQVASLRASLDVFAAAGGMPALRVRSLALTAYLRALLAELLPGRVSVLTPEEDEAHGAQLSLVFTVPVRAVQARLGAEGITVDVREPHVMRVAPAPLYNTAEDVRVFVATLAAVLDALAGQTA